MMVDRSKPKVENEERRQHHYAILAAMKVMAAVPTFIEKACQVSTIEETAKDGDSLGEKM